MPALRLALATVLLLAAAAAAAAPRTLRFAFPGSENGFDPAQVSDVVSAALVGSIFESPLTYDLFARPARLKPRTAAALPEVHDNHTRFVFRIRPGIHFADDPAFKGHKRELTAADYVYSVKRFYDPATRSPTLFHYENAGLLGLSELRKVAIATGTPFPYDTEVAGIRALDRYTFEVRTSRPAPRLPYVFATPPISGAVAREVIEAAAGKTMERPVGTGPFRLAEWKRRSRIVLERNPNHRSVYDEAPDPSDPSVDAATRELALRLRGRPMPLVDRLEFAIIEEGQPRWLAFLNGELDMLTVPSEFAQLAAPGGQVAPNLAKAGVRLHRAVQPITMYTYFGAEHPVLGGIAPAQVALRRALALAYHVPREVELIRKGLTVPAHSVLPPEVSGFDPGFRSEMAEHDPPRAKALLDLYGWRDRDGDGWRETPEGRPLAVEFTTQPDQLSRQLAENWQKSLAAVGVRLVVRTGTWQENIKASRAGKLPMWGTGWSAALPDGGYFLDVLYGPNKGQANHARFDLPAFNALYEEQRMLPDGPERDAVIARALRLSVAYMPLKATGWVVQSWLTHPRAVGYVPHPFIRDYWRYMTTPDGAEAPGAP
ncbi:MAG: ABC transporter substrate-binding protein [Pseudomonadota bacterium]|nr:ABC transporter substrate-binding protein [Rubrivivax sp.]